MRRLVVSSNTAFFSEVQGTAYITQLANFSDGLIAGGSILAAIDYGTGSPRHTSIDTGEGNYVVGIATPTNSTTVFYSAYSNGLIQTIDTRLKEGNSLMMKKQTQGSGELNQISLSSDNVNLVVSQGRRVEVWDVRNSGNHSEPVASQIPHGSDVSCVKVLPSIFPEFPGEDVVVSGGEDQVITFSTLSSYLSPKEDLQDEDLEDYDPRSHFVNFRLSNDPRIVRFFPDCRRFGIITSSETAETFTASIYDEKSVFEKEAEFRAVISLEEEESRSQLVDFVQLYGEEEPQILATSVHGRLLLFGGPTLDRLDATFGTKNAHSELVRCCEVLPHKGGILVTGGEDGIVSTWRPSKDNEFRNAGSPQKETELEESKFTKSAREKKVVRSSPY